MRKLLDVNWRPNVSTLIESFAAALPQWSEARLMGTLGHAFAFSMLKNGNDLMQTSALDWWLYFDVVGHLPREAVVLAGSLKGARQVSVERHEELKAQAWPKVRESIDRGLPAVVWAPMSVEQKDKGAHMFEWASIVGYDDTKGTYLTRHRSTPELHEVRHDAFGHSDPVNWFCVIVLGAEKKPETRPVLEHALAFGRGQRVAADGADAGGIPALELWRGLLIKKKPTDRDTRRAEFLMLVRAAAATFLRELGHTEPADSYTRVSEEASKLANALREGSRDTATLALTAALEHERAAVAKLEACL